MGSTWSPVGAGLLAKAQYQSTLVLNVTAPSRASPLPHWFCAESGPASGVKTGTPGQVPQAMPKTFKTNAYSRATSRNPW
ncbi:hypothetical protein C5612_28725 [Pseudomonas frederiksbergensis]|uniref:Uncharacterized protein n=1 Tax=Pseudomonas frederiksbergensis TaxID=104087 RepID=A0A2S8H6A7_9PSED|nr:hypothetical protein C5612_28725 [Pseudomonas frederiksbergensis]